MNKIPFLKHLEIQNNIDRIREIINSGVLQDAILVERSSLCESALTEFLIRLRDLLAKCKAYSHEIDFNDNIPKEFGNITNLVTTLRNSSCHIESENRLLDNEIPFCFSIVGPLATAKYGRGITNQFNDDIIFAYGNSYAYFKRHLLRGYYEVVEVLNKIEVESPKGYKGSSFGCCWQGSELKNKDELY